MRRRSTRHRHFTANPRFERLPKKFKVGIEADNTGKRHLIQDFGLVLNRLEDNSALYDVWVAGGLGREPQPAILLESEVHEDRIIPLIEAVVRVYTDSAAPGKRLKHLLNSIGENEFRRRIYAEPAASELLPPVKGFAEKLAGNDYDPARRIEAYIFAGQLSAAELEQLADLSDKFSGGVLMLTPDQNIALQLAADSSTAEAHLALTAAGFTAKYPSEQIRFRICPGSHECKVGLSQTRDIAASLIDVLGDKIHHTSWALSGCHNSCSQVQLADIGITTSRMVIDESGKRSPRFDIFRGVAGGLGQKTETGLTQEELIETVCR
jgi:sulfite reductase (ferredoxin)